GLRLHVFRVLLHVRPAAHSAADDVQHREYPRLRAVDDLVAKLAEIAPARAAGVDYSGHSCSKRETIPPHAIFANVFAAHAAGEEMRMNIDQAWRHIQRRDINRRTHARSRNIRRHGSDLSLRDGDVAHGGDAAFRVDDVAPLE